MLGVFALGVVVLVLDPACKSEPSFAKIPDGYSPSLGHAFESAAADLDIQDASVGPVPRWRPPPNECELRYRYRAMTDMAVAERDSDVSTPLRGWWNDGDWTARELAGFMRLELRHRAGDLPKDGTYEGRFGVGEDTVVLKSRAGRAWVETTDDRETWTKTGLWPGINEFFPVLPESGDAFDVSLPLHGGANDKARALDLPTPRAEAITTRVELHAWIEVAGQRAAVIRSRYAYVGGSELLGYTEPESGCGFTRTIELEGEAQYVVLESGILLHAEIREELTQDLGNFMFGGTLTSPIRSEARLVEGCGQPELPDFPDLPGIGPLPEVGR